ncbi:MAG: hypothetical protein RIR10_420, partial [Planctomycetota bacterium]
MAHTGASTDGSFPPAPQSVNGWQSDYVESLFAQFQTNPDSVPSEWKNFFRGFELGLSKEASAPAASSTSVAAVDRNVSLSPAQHASAPEGAAAAATAQRKVDELILRYRTFGHLATQLDPLGTTRPFPEMLTLEAVGLGDDALSLAFDPGTLPLDNPSTLGEIVSCLEQTYCGSMGVEFMHIACPERRAWLAKRLEGTRNRPQFSAEQKKRILSKLLEADSFENFLANRYVGKKRFGLEGGESLIP